MLNSENLILRSLTANDLVKINLWRNDYELNKLTLGIRFPKSIELDKVWLDHMLIDVSNKNIFFGIQEFQSSEFIGTIQLSNIDWISRTGDFGINIGDNSKTGRGYGKEAMMIFFYYVFFDLNLRKINLKVVAYNNNAIAAYQAVGFVKEGILKKEIFYDNQYHDLIMMALFIDDFKKKDS